MRRLYALLAAVLALAPVAAAGQSVRVVNPATGQPVFSSANPAPVTMASAPLPTGGATAANQTTIIGHVDGLEGSVDGIETQLTTLDGRVDQLEGYVDGFAGYVGVASGSADSGDPLKIGGLFTSGSLSAGSTGQRLNALMDDYGNLRVSPALRAGGGAVADAFSHNSIGTYYQTSTNNNAAQFIISASAGWVFNGTSWDRHRGDTNGVPSTPGLSSLTWSYSNGATGILSNTTTAVTIKTAAGASVRNYIDSCTINSTAFGAAVPLAIRDGAGGTVLFALNVPTAGFLQPVNISFEQPLRGTANTLLEVVTTTANTSGTVWVNCQGHTGA